jgi:hypothetical protein
MHELRTKTNKLKYYLVSCLLFTAEPKHDLTGEIKKADYKDKRGRKYWIINNYEKDDWRAYRVYICRYSLRLSRRFYQNILLIQ